MAVRVTGGQDFDLDADAIHHEVFMDGSLYPHTVPELRRAAWALNMVQPDGVTAYVIKGTVPAALGQVAPAAEAVAYGVWAELRDAASSLPGYTDCQM
eukprot:3545079-Lingulodinium_polyedra.AAC.1